MNKPPQPLTGPPPSAPPHPPAPSPGLSQPGFNPQQPSVVFATPPPMNPAQQPPRQSYYQSPRPSLPSNAGRVQTSGSAPRQIPPPHGTHPAHVYQPGSHSQVMMIPQQPIPFANTQGSGYFIPGPYRSPYVNPQQYQVTGSPSPFYPGTSPGDYAGAYYSAQPQFTPPVQPAPVLMSPAPQPAPVLMNPAPQPAPVLMNPAPQQPQALSQQQQQQQAQAKRERKQIRIRDPNQGGRDITEEIMSGGRSAACTPTPPQSAMSVPEGVAGSHANGENTPPAAVAPRTESKGKSPPPRQMPLPQEVPIPPGEDQQPVAPPTPPPTSPISDTVDAPPPAVKKEALPPAMKKEALPPAMKKEALVPLESPIVQPEELQYNGLTAGGSAHISPIAEPDTQREAPMPTAEAPAPAPAAKGKPSEAAKEMPSPAVKESLASIVKKAPGPVVKKAPGPVVKEAPAPVVKEGPAPVVKEGPAPVVKEGPAPVVKEGPAPVVKEGPAPVVKEGPAPVVKEAPAPVVKEAPAVKESLASIVKKAPAPVIKEMPAPIVMEVSVPFVKETPEPVAKAPVSGAKMSSVTELASKADTGASPASVPGPTPEPVVQATVADANPPPVAKDTPLTVAMDTQSDVTAATATPAPFTTAPAEEREESRPPAPESTMQAAISVPKKKRKMKELNKKEMLGDLLDAFKETVPTPPEPEKTTPTAPPPKKEVLHIFPPTEDAEETWEEKEDKLDAANIQSQSSSRATPTENIQSQSSSRATPTENIRPQRSSPAPATPTENIQSQSSSRATPTEAIQSQSSSQATPTEAIQSQSSSQATPTEAIQPQRSSPAPATPTEPKYQYKEEQWKPVDLEAKKTYDRVFLLGFQFSSASLHKPEGLPQINDVVLDKANKSPLQQQDLSRLPGLSAGPDFTPSFANLGRQPSGGRGPPSGGLAGPRRSGQGMERRKEPRKIILSSASLNNEVKLNRAEKAWKPVSKRRVGEEETAGAAGAAGAGGASDGGQEEEQTAELFRRIRSVLNKLTPQMFQPLMKQITEMTIDTEPRLKGVIDLVFEKAIAEPNFSVAYANMCRCLMGLKVPMADKPSVTVNFRKLLLNRCQKEFEKDQDDDEIFEKMQKELEAAKEEEQQRLKDALEEAKDKARRRSLGNIKFIGELFKLKMLTEPIMHDCVVKLLKNHDEESLECLCRLLSTIGKDLDFEKAKPRMDQYFHQMEKIIKEKKTSSRIRFMLQDLLDLRRSLWVPRRSDAGPKTISQIHKDAEMEEAREQVKVQQLMNKKDSGGPRGGPGGGGGGRREGGARPNNQAPDEGWNTVPISTKNRSIDPTRLTKITKPGALDFNTTLLAPGGKGTWGSWGKGSSGGTGAGAGAGAGAKPSDSTPEPARTSTVNRFSALQQSSSSSSSAPETDRRTPQRNSSSRERGDRFERFDRRDDRSADRHRDERPRDDRNRAPMGKGSYSRERDQRPAEGIRRVGSASRERGASKENLKREAAPSPSPAPDKPALTEEELEKKSNAIIEEYLHINDLKEALQCVCELQCSAQLGVFVRVCMEATLERSASAREHTGTLMLQLIKAGTLNTQQYYKGLNELLEVAEDMAIDVPHIWLYLAEIITPMLQEGGIPMATLFKEVAKPLQPMGKAGVMLAEILNLLCKEMSHKKIASLWSEAGLNWRDFLPEDEDVNKFVTEQAVEYTVGEEPVSRKKAEPHSPQQLREELERLLQDKPDNQRIYDWVEANVEEKQEVSSVFVKALMITVCQAAVICEKPYKVDTEQITQRAVLLQRYLKDEEKELQALYALQSLMVQLEQPPNLLRMFFDVLYDEDVIKEEAFYSWETSKDPAEQVGKGVALKSVTAFFTWLREAEDESDNS